jgi:hypothetical protein
MEKPSTTSSPSLTDLPADELTAYACELGLSIEPTTPRGELLRLIRQRQELLIELDRNALLDVVVWARLPVRRSAGKEELAKLVATINRTRFDTLSDRGLSALACLRGVKSSEGDARETVEKRLRRQGGFWARAQRRRRAAVGSMISRLLEGAKTEDDYRFLPEEDATPTLKETIEDVGVVGGIAQKLRGAADEYLHQKLNEIERRIDRKLDEIDHRLGEWRDQEVRNRLRLIKITLVTAIVVAIISLGYNYLKARSRLPDHATQAVPAAREPDPAG